MVCMQIKRKVHDLIFILCLDGLDHDMVADWQLSHLMQKQHHPIQVPVSYVRQPDTTSKPMPISPSVWASFLTGKWIRDYGINMNPYPNWGSLEEPPFTRFFKTSYMFNVPFINYDFAASLLMHLWSRGSFTLMHLRRMLRMVYSYRKEMLVRLLRENNGLPLFVAYFHFPDVYTHIAKRRSQLQKHYEDLNSFVATLKEELTDDDTFIILSDHGFDWNDHMHGQLGFYSCNRELVPNPHKITYFYEWLKREGAKIIVTQVT